MITSDVGNVNRPQGNKTMFIIISAIVAIVSFLAGAPVIVTALAAAGIILGVMNESAK